MKKFYTILLAASVAVSASAVQRHVSATKLVVPANSSKIVSSKTTTAFAAPAKAVAVNDIEGEYTYTATTLLSSGDDINNTVTITVTDAATGAVEIDGLIPNIAGLTTTTVPATFNAAAGTLSIANNIHLGADSDGDINLYFKEAAADGSLVDGISSMTACVGTFTMDAAGNKTVEFPVLDIWALGDANLEDLGWYRLCYQNKFVYEVPVPDNRTWKNVGKATFQDGYTLPLWGLDQADFAVEVDLEKCNENGSQFRLVNPYGANSLLAQAGLITGKDGYIEVDLTDPDHVSMGVVASGFSDAQSGIVDMYCYNTLTVVLEVNKGLFQTLDEAIEFAKSKGFLFSTFKDGVVLIPSVVDATKGYKNDACFGIQGNKNGGYSWKSEDGKTANMETKITFPAGVEAGISDVIVDDENAPVEFFNLQGMRINEPAAGTVVIRRQGSKTQKVLVK